MALGIRFKVLEKVTRNIATEHKNDAFKILEVLVQLSNSPLKSCSGFEVFFHFDGHFPVNHDVDSLVGRPELRCNFLVKMSAFS